MQLPPHIHKLGCLGLLTRCVENPRKRARLGFGVPRRLVPIRLRVGEVCAKQRPWFVGQRNAYAYSIVCIWSTGAVE